MRKIFLVILLTSIVFVSGCTTGKVVDNSNAQDSIKVGSNVGDKAPNFIVTTTEDRTVSLSEFTKKSKPVVLYFFATWCPYCTEELTQLKNVYPEYKDKVDFVAVDLDLGENHQIIEKYKTKRGYLGYFATGSRDILSAYNVVRTTTKYGIDKDGTIIYKGEGELTPENWKTLFSELEK